MVGVGLVEGQFLVVLVVRVGLVDHLDLLGRLDLALLGLPLDRVNR